MDLNSILTIVGIVVLLGVAGASVFAIMKLREVLGMMDTKVEPMLDDLGSKLGTAKQVVAQSEDLMREVNITMDSLDVTLVELDEKLDKAVSIGNQIVGAPETVSTITKSASSAVKSAVFPNK